MITDLTCEQYTMILQRLLLSKDQRYLFASSSHWSIWETTIMQWNLEMSHCHKVELWAQATYRSESLSFNTGIDNAIHSCWLCPYHWRTKPIHHKNTWPDPHMKLQGSTDANTNFLIFMSFPSEHLQIQCPYSLTRHKLDDSRRICALSDDENWINIFLCF